MVYSRREEPGGGQGDRSNVGTCRTRDGWPIKDLGLEITGSERAAGEVFVDTVSFAGGPTYDLPSDLPRSKTGEPLGWIVAADLVDCAPFVVGQPVYVRVRKDLGRGLAVTGTTDWRDYTFEATAAMHLADAGGTVVRYQGLERYLALVMTKGRQAAADPALARQQHGAGGNAAEVGGRPAAQVEVAVQGHEDRRLVRWQEGVHGGGREARPGRGGVPERYRDHGVCRGQV